MKLIKHAQRGPNVQTPRDTVKVQGPGSPQAQSPVGTPSVSPMLTNKPVDGITDSMDMSLNV